MSALEILAAVLGSEPVKKITPEIARVGLPYLAKAAAAMFRGDETAAAKHIRIGAQKVAAKAIIRAPLRPKG